MALHGNSKRVWELTRDLANDIVDEARVQLMLKFRFLDRALWRMPLEAVRTRGRFPLSTDTQTVYFEPDGVLARFEASESEMVRDYLHMTMHCVFRHPFDDKHPHLEPWGIACDVIAESAAMELCDTRFESEDDPQRRQILSELEVAVGTLTPGKLYRLFDQVLSIEGGGEVLGFDERKLREVELLFERDDHSIWPGPARNQEQGDAPGAQQDLGELDENAQEQAQFEGESQGMRQQERDEQTARGMGQQQNQQPQEGEDAGQRDDGGADDEPQDSPSADDANPQAEGNRSDQGQGAGERDITQGDDAQEQVHDDQEQPSQGDQQSQQQGSDDMAQNEEEWLQISKQIEMDLQTFSRQWGSEAANFVETLQVANRKLYNYTEFLRRFSVVTEDMRVNNDEFDYIYYTYGLQLYGDIPLVEPLEYMDTHRVRDFVIAVDTSESCSGWLVRRFVQHTFEILRESQAFGGRVNIHVIQCDSKVQTDTKLTDLRDVDTFLDGFTVRGFGGTDFRPVFDYIATLRETGELTDLQGMVYFTDGLGTFPAKAPTYDVAFVFMDQGGLELPPVPPWAMKVIIDEEGIANLQDSSQQQRQQQ